jgi:Tfp pilus assembly PilM family ATPase
MSLKDKFNRDIFFKEYVALDITGSEVRVISVRRNKIRKWGSEPLRDGLVKDGIILEPQTLGLIIDNLF